MISKLLRYFALKTNDVRLQLLWATLYGLVSIYGWGTVPILMKARKMTNAKTKRHKVATSKTKGDV